MKLHNIKGFWPYIMLVFFNTFIDLGHKILIQDTLYQTASGSNYTVLSSIINALILLPYILLFTPSGFISDKFPKATVLKITAAAAIPLTVMVTWCYYQGYFWGAFSMTFLLAVQSALNSPAKYGYIKELFGKEQLSQMNAVVQTLTILAILGATFAFTSIFSSLIQAAGLQLSADNGLLLKAFAPAGFLLIAFSIFETTMAFRLVKNEAADPASQYEPAKYFQGYYLKSYLNKTRHPKVIFTCIIGLSVFWAINQVLLASYGAFLKEHVGNVSVMFAQGSLAMAGIGILLGALYAGKASKGFIETGLIPVAAIGITAGLFILPHLSGATAIVLLFLAYGFFGGMLIVPLNALIQFNSARNETGKVQSANNFLQNCFMLGFLGMTVLFGLYQVDSLVLLYGLFVIALAGAIYTLVTLPQSLVRYGLYLVASRFYRLSVYQLDNLPSSGGVLLLGNHVSFIDWAVVQIACPRPIRFVMEKAIYERWYLTWIFKQFNVIPISRGASQDALAEINRALNAGEVVALFPEGRLSKNGQMGIFRSGFERSAVNAEAVIIPFYIHGLWGSKTSYASRDWKPSAPSGAQRRVSVVYGAAMPIDSNAQAVRQAVRKLSISAWNHAVNDMKTIPAEWLRTAKHKPKATAIIQEDGKTVSSRQLLASVLFLRSKLKARLKHQERVGILLPSGTGGILANLSLLCLGKTVVNLNPMLDQETLESALKQAGITTILSSRLFLQKLDARAVGLQNALAASTLINLEDELPASSRRSILAWMVLSTVSPAWLLQKLFIKSASVRDTAVILFSSGSEGQPKGVELSHANIISNINQVSSVLGLEDSDVMLNALPLFHAFGLTITSLLPLLKGIPMLCCADPTKTLAIAKLIARYKVTLCCSTSSLLGLYARNPAIHPKMLASLRRVIAGAEKLSPTVYKEFKEKFNQEIFEGYGATEVAPVASCNLPDVLSTDDWHVHKANKAGTVGLPLPGCAFRIVDPVTLEDLPIGEDGLILIGGIQVMKGYLGMPEKVREVLIQEGDYTWYKTGDKGHLDEDGFLTLVDRYSRFAKIGGEMVSLGHLEQEWQRLANEESVEIMALALPDDKKGEQLALLYQSAQLAEDDLKARLLDSTLPRLMLPRHIKQVAELPRLGNGKRDYQSARHFFS